MNYNNWDSLNEAKKKILFLLQVKCGDPATEYIESDDTDADVTFQKVVSGVKTSSNTILQALSYITYHKDVQTKSGTVTGKPYYRSVNTYVAFQQALVNLISSLKNVNQILVKVVPNIGYVEPENMNLYQENIEELKTAFIQLNKVIPLTNVDSVQLKNADQTQLEKDNLKANLTTVHSEIATLRNFDNEINATYNYKNGNVHLKRSPPTTIEQSTPSTAVVDDDDDF